MAQEAVLITMNTVQDVAAHKAAIMARVAMAHRAEVVPAIMVLKVATVHLQDVVRRAATAARVVTATATLAAV